MQKQASLVRWKSYYDFFVVVYFVAVADGSFGNQIWERSAKKLYREKKEKEAEENEKDLKLEAGNY